MDITNPQSEKARPPKTITFITTQERFVELENGYY